MKLFNALTLSLVFFAGLTNAQGPTVTSWLQNTSGITGRHYVSGNSTPINDATAANVQTVQYSSNWVYVSTNGIPAYITGPFLGNPSLASNQNAIFKFPLVPLENTGTPTNTNGGNIGVFINGVALFDYRDGVSWNNQTQAEAGGPIMGPPGQGIWNRDAIPAERDGFDCAKGHPAMGNYHHHQNPSAFNLDLVVLSTICDTYAADGLYVINTNEHSPLIGYAYDGFPIYGAYGFANTDGTGGTARMKSGFQLRAITTRTIYADGTDVTDGPAVNATYPLGHYREDYEFISHPGMDDYLDVHNGRFCVTPEYPAGTYAYFCTVDANHNSAYPYVVGPTFYGTKVAAKVTSITEAVTAYTPNEIGDVSVGSVIVNTFPNPVQDVLAVQVNNINRSNVQVDLLSADGKLIASTILYQGSTIAHFDTRTLYNGTYLVRVRNGKNSVTKKIVVSH